MNRVKLTQGKYALVDDEDFEWLNQWKWCFSHGYAQTRSRGKKEYMHRMILGAPKHRFVDHINRDGLDNQRCNIRLCTVADNQHNRIENRNNTTGYKNIIRLGKKWRVGVMKDYKSYTKVFENLGAAVLYRDRLIERLHGNFARTEIQ